MKGGREEEAAPRARTAMQRAAECREIERCGREEETLPPKLERGPLPSKAQGPAQRWRSTHTCPLNTDGYLNSAMCLKVKRHVASIGTGSETETERVGAKE